MRKTLLVVFFVLLAGTALSQETYFGKNKVHYKDFDWSFIQSRHFDIYFYEGAYPTAKFAANVLESAYVEISHELNYYLQRRVPVFVYNSQSDFQQTNITSELLPEAVGGFTEAFKNRIVVPFVGSYEDFRHVLHHELTHAVVYDLVYGNLLSSLLSQRRLFQVPLWFAEGYAEYSSRHGWDYFSDMFVRDATINGYLQPTDYLDGFLAYKEGQALVKYIADKYGEDKLGEILQKGKIHLTMNKALKAALNIDEKQLNEDFAKEMKRRYWPAIAQRKEADEIGQQLTHSRKDGSYFNEQPVFSPEGDKIAIFTDKSDYTEIVLVSAVDGHVISKIVKGERSADLESLHSYVSGMSFSPDGRKMVFVAKAKDKDALMFVDIKKRHIYKKKRLGFYNALAPAWSSDGKSIAFSALKGYKRDLFVYDIAADKITQLTDDRFDDGYPSWTPDSKTLIFSSDRPHPETPVLTPTGHPYSLAGAYKPGDFEYGDYQIFRINVESKQVDPVDVGPGQNQRPVVSPDGLKIAFISNRNGTDNIYVGYLDSAKNYPVTDVLTGIQSASWSPDGQKLAFSAFSKGGFDVFVQKDLVPVGHDGALQPTDFVTGKYNILDSAGLPIASKSTDSSAGDQPKTVEAASASQTADSASAADGGKAVAGRDSTKTKRDTAGVYGDEYVFSSGHKTDPLDSLFRAVRNDDTAAMRGPREPLKEPAAFDSVQGQLATGEYKVQKYKVKFTPDFVGGGFAYDTFFGLRGQSYFLLSDYLGNHQILVAADLVNTIDQSNVQAYYINQTSRINWGGGIFHTKNYYLDAYDYLFSDRFYGGQLFLQRPFSIFSRVELIGAEYFIDRQYYDINDPRHDRSSKVTTGALSFVTDNVVWGETGPVNGHRSKLTLSSGVNLFDAGDIEFYALDADYRKYWHFLKSFSLAFRVAAGGSTGNTPKQYFLGGTTNWIGNRTYKAQVYEVENLYFSDVVTPLRGVEYYGLNGDRFGLVNMEFRFPMIQYFVMRFPLPLAIANVQGALFSDIGSAWFGNNFRGWTTIGDHGRLQDIRMGFGAGLRANLFNFVLLRYDIAWGTDLYNVTPRPKQYVSFGADF